MWKMTREDSNDCGPQTRLPETVSSRQMSYPVSQALVQSIENGCQRVAGHPWVRFSCRFSKKQGVDLYRGKLYLKDMNRLWSEGEGEEPKEQFSSANLSRLGREKGKEVSDPTLPYRGVLAKPEERRKKSAKKSNKSLPQSSMKTVTSMMAKIKILK